MGLGNDLTLKVGFDIDKFSRELAKTNSTLDKWGKGVEGSLNRLGAAFSAVAIGKFTLDMSKLAGEAVGVKAAFDKLPESVALMRQLTQATGGTVAELELMKRSVMASNFDISLKALPKLLEFATLRARQTGQSVDYLVDSIVTGIGRKSKLILDNLGISAVQLTEALGGASAASSTIGQVADAVGKIAEENLKKMGKLTDDAAVKADRLAASWANLKVTFGTRINDAGFDKVLQFLDFMLGGHPDKAAESLQQLRLNVSEFNKGIGQFNDGGQKIKDWMAEMNLQAQKAGVNIKFLTEGATVATRAIIEMKKSNQVWIDASEVKNQVRNIAFLEEQIKKLEEEIKLTDKPTLITKWQNEIEALQKEIDRLLGKVKKVVDLGSGPAPKLVDFGSGPILKPKNKTTWFGDEDGPQFNDEAWKKAQERMEAVARTAGRIGDSIGQALGNVISGAQTFAQAMANMAMSVIDSLERMALAFMIENSAKFGPVGIAAAAIGFGVIKALFSKIGKGSSAGSSISSARINSGGGGGNYLMVSGQFVMKGQDMVATIRNANRSNSRGSTIDYLG